MASGLIVRPLAAADLDDAARWYEAEQARVAARSLSDVDRAFARIAERPRQIPPMANSIRRALLRAFL